MDGKFNLKNSLRTLKYGKEPVEEEFILYGHITHNTEPAPTLIMQNKGTTIEQLT